MWDVRRKKHVRIQPKEGFKSKAVRQSFPSLTKVPSSNANFRKALALVSRCYESYVNGQMNDIDDSPKTFRAPGPGRKAIAPEVREAAFQWFIDVRGSLKGRLPKKVF